MRRSSGMKSKANGHPRDDAKTLKLNADDLMEFRLRRNSLDLARFNFLMVEESYQAWCLRMAAKYGMEGKFNIDAGTGLILKIHEHARSDSRAQAS